MDASSRRSELDPKYLLGQLNTARKEINNLRQQVKSLRYILEKDVAGIKDMIRSYVDGKFKTTHGSLPMTIAQPSTSSEEDTLKLKPIGLINTGFSSKRATPRQPGIWKSAPGKVTLFNSTFTNPEHALSGLQDFSHMWILFHFHRNYSTHVRAKVAPPRLNGLRTGVFSTRSPHRPCPIGLSLVKIVRMESNVIYFEGVDMVDETPVLDIKPYIPQYDNPLHIEKMLVRPNDDTAQVREVSGPAGIARLEDSTDPSTSSSEQRFNSIYVDLGMNGEFRRIVARDNVHPGSGEEACRVLKISRDEEIAMRLQAEEFEASPSFDDFRSRNYFVSHPIAAENTIPESSYRSNSMSEIRRDAAVTAIQNYEQNTTSHVQEIRTSFLHGDAQNHTSQIDDLSRDEVDRHDSQISRNSRLLDGADGPSTVCGTDMDLVNRRALDSRTDNSPIRMGIREAPDGEEGFESQPLMPSQTVANIHAITTLLPSSNNMEIITSNSSNETRATTNVRSENFEVRVPEWISRPRTPSLSVIFNERALSQLNEILAGKAEEQKRAIQNVLQEDPRSVYLRQRWGNQFYTFLIHDLHISCRFDDNHGIVTVFQVRHAGRTCECGEPEWQCLGHSPPS